MEARHRGVSMLRGWFVLAIRYSMRERLYSVLNIVGLSVGLTAGTLVLGLIDADLHFDDYLASKDRLFRLVAVGAGMPAAELRGRVRGVPGVESAVRACMPLGQDPIVRRGRESFIEPDRLFVDDDFPEVFGFPLASGDREGALVSPSAIVLTESAARRYFTVQDPIGQTLHLDETGREHTVTAVLRDPPANSHLQFAMLIPISARPSVVEHQPVTLYLRLRSPEDQGTVEPALTKAFLTGGGSATDGSATEAILEPVGRVHLSSRGNPFGPTRSWNDLVICSSVAVLLLLIACGNYANLSLARSVRRLREVGIRKALGASRLAVVSQHVSESVLNVGLALAISIGLVEIAGPAFQAAIGRSVAIRYGEHWLWLQLAGLGLAVALVAGGYPAVVQARRRTVWALAGKGGGGDAPRLRGVLVFTQFAVTIAVLAMGGVTYLQLDYLRTKDLGFDTRDMLVVDARKLGEVLYQGLERGATRLDFRIVKDALRLDPQIEGVTLTGAPPGDPFYPHMSYRAVGSDRPPHVMETMVVDHDYLSTLGLELAKGRWFEGDFASDGDDGLVLNETAARQLGAGTGDVVSRLDILGEAMIPVIGIVRDSHYRSLYHPIPPMAFRLHPDPNRMSFLSHMIVRGVPGSGPELAESVRGAVAELTPEGPVELEFLDHVFAWEVLYEKESRMAKVLGGFSLLGIGTACLGLLGLAAYASESRKREAALRKVLGASLWEVVTWLSAGYVRLVVVASVVACPTAYLIARRWLEAFPYRIDLGAGVFAGAALLVLVLASATAAGQALRAWYVDPATTLRHE